MISSMMLTVMLLKQLGKKLKQVSYKQSPKFYFLLGDKFINRDSQSRSNEKGMQGKEKMKFIDDRRAERKL